MLNCKIKPFLTPLQKYSNKNRYKRSVFFHQELEFTFPSKYRCFSLQLAGEELSGLKVFPFLGIWDSRIYKFRQLKAIWPALLVWVYPISTIKANGATLTPSGFCPLNVMALIIHKLSL